MSNGNSNGSNGHDNNGKEPLKDDPEFNAGLDRRGQRG